MCLPLLGLGEFDYKGKRYPGSELEKMFGWKPLTLASKEGLALLNGTQFMLAHAVWCIIRAEHISAAADKIATVSLEAFNGRKEPFTPGVSLPAYMQYVPTRVRWRRPASSSATCRAAS